MLIPDGAEQILLELSSGDGCRMDGTMQRHYKHSVTKGKKEEEGIRYSLVMRNGLEKAVTDNGFPAAGDAAPFRPHDVAGHHPDVEEGRCYSRHYLFAGMEYGDDSRLGKGGAHLQLQKGVSGNIREGCRAVIISSQMADKREDDALFTFRYTSSRRQGAAAVVTSYNFDVPVRVFRSSTLHNEFAPVLKKGQKTALYRYDGLYKVKLVFDNDGNLVQEAMPPGSEAQYTFCFERDSTSNLTNTQLWKKVCESRGIVDGGISIPSRKVSISNIGEIPLHNSSKR